MSSNNNVREIRTRLSLDGETAFRKSLKSVDSSLSAMKSELKNVSANFDESTAGMTKNQKKAEILGRMQDTLKGKIGALADAVETSTKEYEDARKKAEELTAEYGEQSDKAKAAWQEVETLGNKMDRMTTLANNAQSKLADVTGQLRDVDSDSDDAAEAIEDAGKAAEDAGNGGFTIMKGAAADLVSEGLSAVYDSLKDIVTEFGGMDSVYNNFAIKTGASAKEMEGYSESIMSLYKEGYADSLSGVSDSMAVVKQSLGDAPTDQLEEVTEYAITLEETLGYDVAESMRTVNTLADQFGIAYSDAFDLIVQGAQNGLDQNGDLLDVINEYSVQFKNSGYGAEEMFNMLANGAAEGVWSVDKLGDSVKEFNIRLSDGTADEALQKLGLNVDDVKAKISAGGETAQAANQQIITSLMAVSDENERYILGQQLMGTMWEDLGEDAIAAMYNTQGEISTTKDVMQEVIDLKYDDIGTRLEKVGRKAKTEIAEPIIEKWMPKIEDGIEWVSENLDDLIPVIETVGTVALTAFAAKKVINFGSSIVSGIKGISSVVTTLTTKTVAQTAAQTALNATNPFGWAVLAVGAVGTLAAIAASSAKEYDDMVDHFSELTEAEEEVRLKTEEVVGQYNDWKTAKDTAINEKQTEFTYYDELWNELQGIVDQNGFIKTGYEDRAKFITEKLGAVTGEEIRIVDGQIQKYDELTKSIEKALLMKKAEAIQGALGESYNEALIKQVEARDQAAAERALLDDMKSQLVEKRTAVDNLESMGYYEWAKQNNITADEAVGVDMYQDAIKKAQAEYDGLYKKIYIGDEDQAAQVDVLKQAEDAYTGYMATIANYNALTDAIDENDEEALEESLLRVQYDFKDHTNATKEQLEEQKEYYEKNIDELRYAIEHGMPGVTQEMIDQVEELSRKTDDEIKMCDDKWYASMRTSYGALVQAASDTIPDSENAAAELMNLTLGIISDQKYIDWAAEAGSNVGSTYANSMINTIDALSEHLGMDFTTGFAADADVSTIAAEEARKAFERQAKREGIPGFASGVDNFRGGLAIINENHRGELVNLPNGSQVVPHDISIRYAEEAAAQAGSVYNSFGSINIAINNPSLSSGQDIRLTAAQLSDTLISEISRRIDGQKRRSSSAVGR